MKKLLLILLFDFTFLTIIYTQKVQSYSLPPAIPQEWKEFSDRIYLSIEKQAHYLLGTVHEWEKDSNLKLLTESKIGEHWIRPNTGAVAGFSFLYQFGDYDQKVTGVTRSQLLNEYIIPMMRYLVHTHLTGDTNTSEGKKWGNAWQSAHWTYEMAKGAWFIWDNLPGDIQDGIRRVVKYEAARFYIIEPPYRLKSNTASEENAWNSQIFHIAILLMPGDKDVQLWEELLKKWVISSYVRPADLKSDITIDGINLNTFKGANVYDDYTLENHGIVHPDYMGAYMLTTQFALDYKIQHKKIPDFIFFNIRGIYENLKWFALPDGGLNYPSGQDWTIFGNPDWLFHHCHMAAFFKDPDAPELARRVLDCTEIMQKRNPQGNVYTKEENYFPSAHSDLIFYGMLSWLTMWYMDDAPDQFAEKKGVKAFESGKLVINRTSKAIHSLSWGAKIMFQSLPNRYDRVFDSDMYNGIGYIILKGSKEVLPITLGGDFDLKTKRNQFEASFSVNHGTQVTAFYNLKSSTRSLKVTEKLVANEVCTTQTIATSYYGVLNNKDWIYERGQRKILVNGDQFYVFKSAGGDIKLLSAREISIDRSVIISSKKVMNVSYESIREYENSRLTDRLILNNLKGEKPWEKGDIISQVTYKIKTE
jgi:hypothetical protein